MKGKDFIVVKRPALAKIIKHPTIGFANYERRLESVQPVMQSIQQAYLGTRNGPLSFSRAGIPPARAELFAGSVGHWTQEVSRYIRLRRRCRTNAADTTCNAFGKSSRTPGKS